MNIFPRGKGIDLGIALLLFVFALSAAQLFAAKTPAGQPPDEYAHLGYVNDIATGHRVAPNYSHSKIINSSAQNYLTHPPLYYSVLGMTGRALDWNLMVDLYDYRLLSGMMVAAGLVLWFFAARRLGLGPKTAALLSLCPLAVPMFPYLAGSVNNDNLCYLGVAVFFYGFSLLPERSPKTYYLLALGAVLTALTKATGAAFLVVFTITWLGLERHKVIRLISSKHAGIAGAIALACILSYYLPTYLAHHTFFPAPRKLYAELKPPSQPISFADYVGIFGSTMWERLPVILASRLIEPVPHGLRHLFYLMLCLPAALWLVTCRTLSTEARFASTAFFIAIAVTLAINLYVGWQGYKQTGIFAGIQPRYYNYALPGMFIFALLEKDRTILGRASLLVLGGLTALFLAVLPPRVAARLSPPSRTTTHEMDATAVLQRQEHRILQPTEQTGHIDTLSITGTSAQVIGWAIDASSKAPARSIWVSVDGKFIGSVKPDVEREDVAKALHSSAVISSGFDLVIHGLPKGIDGCDLTVFAEQNDGSLLPMTNSHCAR